jgi:hypothetical protein
VNTKETIQPHGIVEFIITKKKPTLKLGNIKSQYNGFKVYDSVEIVYNEEDLVETMKIKNIILDGGKDSVISSLSTGNIKTICRMAIGDRGTIASDQTVPKSPTPDRTTLYNEIYRGDVDAVTVNVGSGTHEIRFVKTFNAVDIPITSFSNQSNPIVNEVALVMADIIAGNPLPRVPVTPPTLPDTDELLFAMRTFKSVPFDAANDLSITVRYTIYIE